MHGVDPTEARARCQLWIRVDSARFSKAVVETAIHHSAITAEQNTAVRKAIETLAVDPETVWTPAENADCELTGSEVAETTYRFAGRDLRLIVRPSESRLANSSASTTWREAVLRVHHQRRHRALGRVPRPPPPPPWWGPPRRPSGS